VENIRGITNSLQASFLGGCKVLTDKDLLKLKPEENEQDKEIKNVKILDEGRKVYFKATILVKTKDDFLDECRDLAELSLIGSGDKRYFIQVDEELVLDDEVGVIDGPESHEYVLDQEECDRLYNNSYAHPEFKELVYGHAGFKHATKGEIFLSTLAKCFDPSGEVLKVKVQTKPKEVKVHGFQEVVGGDLVERPEIANPKEEKALRGALTDNHVSHIPKGVFLGLSIIFALSIVTTMFILPPFGLVFLPTVLMNLPVFIPIILAVAPVILSAVTLTNSGQAKAVSLYFVSAAAIMTILMFGAPLVGLTLPFLALLIPAITIPLGVVGIALLNKFRDKFAVNSKIHSFLKFVCLVIIGTPIVFGLVRYILTGTLRLILAVPAAIAAINLTDSLFSENGMQKFGDMRGPISLRNVGIFLYKGLLGFARIVIYPIFMIVLGLVSSIAGVFTKDNPFQKIKFAPNNKWALWMKFWYGISKYFAANAARILLIASIISIVVAASAVTGGLPAIVAALPFIKSIAFFVAGIPYIGTFLTGWLVSAPVQLIFASTLGAYATAIIGFAVAIYFSYPLIRQVFSFINEVGVFIKKMLLPLYRRIRGVNDADINRLRQEAEELELIKHGRFDLGKLAWEDYIKDTRNGFDFDKRYIKLKIQAGKYKMINSAYTFETFIRPVDALVDLTPEQVAAKIKKGLKTLDIQNRMIKGRLIVDDGTAAGQVNNFVRHIAEQLFVNRGQDCTLEVVEEVLELRKHLISKNLINNTVAEWDNFLDEVAANKNIEWLRKKVYWVELSQEVRDKNLLNAPETMDQFLLGLNTVEELRNKKELRRLQKYAIKNGVVTNADAFADFILNPNRLGDLSIKEIKEKIVTEQELRDSLLVNLRERAEEIDEIHGFIFNRDKPIWKQFTTEENIANPDLSRLKTASEIRLDVELLEAAHAQKLELEEAAETIHLEYRPLAERLKCLKGRFSGSDKPTWAEFIFKYPGHTITEDSLKAKLANYPQFRRLRDIAVAEGFIDDDISVEEYIRGEAGVNADKTVQQLTEEINKNRLRRELQLPHHIRYNDLDLYLSSKPFAQLDQEVRLKQRADIANAIVRAQSIEEFINGKTLQDIRDEVDLLKHYNDLPIAADEGNERARPAVLLKRRAEITMLREPRTIVEFAANKTIEVLTKEVVGLEINKRAIDAHVVIGDFEEYSRDKDFALIEQHINLKIRAQRTGLLPAEQTLEQFVNEKEIEALELEVRLLQLHRDALTRGVVNNGARKFEHFIRGIEADIEAIKAKIQEDAGRLADGEELEELNDRIN